MVTPSLLFLINFARDIATDHILFFFVFIDAVTAAYLEILDSGRTSITTCIDSESGSNNAARQENMVSVLAI